MKFKGLFIAVSLISSMLSVAPAYAIGGTLDEVLVPPGYANAGVSYQTERYQTFTAGMPGPLARLDLSLAKDTPETSEPITVKLLSTNLDGEPNVNEVLAQTSIPASRVGQSKSWVRVIFSNPYDLVAGVKYALELTTDGQNPAFNWFGNDWNDTNYTGGSASTHVISMDLWYRNGHDLGFRTYSGAYTAPSTTVAYNLDGGTSAIPIEENQGEGDTFPIPANPTKPGFAFNGWTDQNGDLYGGFDYIRNFYTMGQSNVVLTANWLSLAHPISRLVRNNGNGGDEHWNWVGGGLHEGVDVEPGWCVIEGPGSNPATWIVTGRNHGEQSETFLINTPNQFQASAYTFSPDPNISITKGASQVVKPNQPIVSTEISNIGCSASRYTISPALPQGLVLNEQTGVISGTPTAALARTVYTVTAERLLNEDTLEPDADGFKLGEHSKTFTLTVSSSASIAVAAKPLLTQYFTQNQTALSPYDLLKLKTAVSKLRDGASVKLVAYVYGSGSSANRYSKSFASILAKSIKKINPSLNVSSVLKYCRTAPKAAPGSKWIEKSIRVDLAK